jgi:hypothetical protein
MTSNRLIPTTILGLLLAWNIPSPAQERGKSDDEALDSLIKKLAVPKAGPDRPAAKPEAKPSRDDARSEPKAKPAAPQSVQPGKSADARKPGSGEVSGKDKELDELLEKMGETKDRPQAPDRPASRPPGGEPGDRDQPGGGGKDDRSRNKAKAPDLQGKDKEIDERLEEFAGKRRKKNRPDQEEGSGPLGQIIKEMRDVEQKLGKPETGEDTQSKQKQIVKRIETLIQQVKQSGSQGQMAMRMVRQPGQMPGEQQGQQQGANARGAPPMKPAKPPERHAMADGKDIWGHLPPELRQEMENVFKEEALPPKEDLIKRYYLSIAKQKLQRGE